MTDPVVPAEDASPGATRHWRAATGQVPAMRSRRPSTSVSLRKRSTAWVGPSGGSARSAMPSYSASGRMQGSGETASSPVRRGSRSGSRGSTHSPSGTTLRRAGGSRAQSGCCATSRPAPSKDGSIWRAPSGPRWRGVVAPGVPRPRRRAPGGRHRSRAAGARPARVRGGCARLGRPGAGRLDEAMAAATSGEPATPRDVRRRLLHADARVRAGR